MMTRTFLCLPVLIVPSVGRWERQFMSPVAVTQLTGGLLPEGLDVVDAAGVRCQLCDAAVGMGSDSMSFACCPQSAFQLACLAPIANIVDHQVGCPVCVGERREHVNAVWFQRLCHINGVQWLVEAVQTSDIDCTLCCEPMVPDDSIVVPCCQHRLHVSCLSRSLSSCGLRCPYCSQDLSEFAASSSFQAASVFHECIQSWPQFDDVATWVPSRSSDCVFPLLPSPWTST